ncbi:Eco57I restriction-modification methylase domain-containing protein [Hyphococcus lacteus]|uniref:site-specific DNA-methyltransferase (adenine-specific) n=1 Tax=Hyphococcus lacteus TaxID=3143536 RepID=A0ABV3Z5F5_9PROT
MSLHSEWLSLIDVSGPFLAEPVLDAAFPQGLAALDGKKRKGVRQAYYELRESQTQDDPDYPKLHRAWIQYILSDVLEWDDDRSAQNLKSAADFGETYAHDVPGHSVTLNPELAFLSSADELPSIFVISHPPDTPLDGPINTDGWIASPVERMVELCRANTVRLGLITNGEHWMLIDAPTGGVTTFASWYGGLWAQEPKTLQAFISLFDVGRFFLPAEDQLPALLDRSLEFQDDVTDALGEQVRRAVEVLIQAFDRADTDRNQTLLTGVKPAELYEAGLTIMMRIVFLLSAEERDLLLLGNERYEANYAITTLRRQLRETSEEILEKRWDAWSRLLALFRAVYGGVDHQTMRLPALGGSLFDPDRFPFLEGRAKGTSWTETEALPLPIDNKTVLLLLEAVQLFRGRTLSYRALDVEQIGYVYEGLLERTAVKAKDVTLDLNATKNAKNPWVKLTELEDAAETDTVAKLLKERTGSSASRVTNDLAKEGDKDALAKLLVVCQNNEALRDKLAPYIHFIRIDPWNYPLVYPKGSFMVAAGTDRRESGTHYTPKSLTEQIVETTLTPLAYSGPAEGKPKEEWTLKSSAELLDLRICDPAMGSGAFLVQVCRWLSEKLIEAWLTAERNGNAITIDGRVISPDEANELAPDDLEERLILAKRLVAERCLYGVDMNPLAVELAKLSIWLITLSKGRPFGFLDHNLKAGDSLIGITSIEQLTTLDMIAPEKASPKLFAHDVDQAVSSALELRKQIRSSPVNDIRDVEIMASLDQQAKIVLRIPTVIADALVGETLASNEKKPDTTSLSIFVGQVLGGDDRSISELTRRATQKLNAGLPKGKNKRRPFHWPLEFPEVFTEAKQGFDGIVGNPPFIGNTYWKERLGSDYQRLGSIILGAPPGKIDLCILFLRRMADLLSSCSAYGMLATNNVAEGSAISVGLGELVNSGDVFASVKGLPWPGKAAVEVSIIHYWNGKYRGEKIANGQKCKKIGPRLNVAGDDDWQPKKIDSAMFSLKGADNSKGLCFVITPDHPWFLKLKEEKNSLLVPYITGNDLTSFALNGIDRWALDVLDRELEEIQASWPLAYEFLTEVAQPNRNEKALKSYKGLKDRWWQFWNHRASQMRRLREKREFIGFSRVTKYPVCMLCPSDWIYTDKVVLIELLRADELAICQSSFFKSWVTRYSGGRMEGRLTISITEALGKFPPPRNLVSKRGIEAAQAFNTNIVSWSVSESCGLTDAINAINNPNITTQAIENLRSTMMEVDACVAEAYGWQDINLEHSFTEKEAKAERDKIQWGCSLEAQIEIIQKLIELNKSYAQSANDQLTLDVS